jgi:hypothetical protein
MRDWVPRAESRQECYVRCSVEDFRLSGAAPRSKNPPTNTLRPALRAPRRCSPTCEIGYSAPNLAKNVMSGAVSKTSGYQERPHDRRTLQRTPFVGRSVRQDVSLNMRDWVPRAESRQECNVRCIVEDFRLSGAAPRSKNPPTNILRLALRAPRRFPEDARLGAARPISPKKYLRSSERSEEDRRSGAIRSIRHNPKNAKTLVGRSREATSTNYKDCRPSPKEKSQAAPRDSAHEMRCW